MDSRYAQEIGYMGPYRNTRYHIDDFRGRPEHTLSAHEKFNLVHSRLRNVVERTFGVLKQRWRILRGVPFCPVENQVKIIVACFALHNYLWEWEHGDGSIAKYPLSEWVTVNEDSTMSVLRELITAAMFSDLLAKVCSVWLLRCIFVKM